MSKVLVISTSLHEKSNLDIPTEKIIEEAKASGHDTDYTNFKGKNIGFFIGCLTCKGSQKCVIGDDGFEFAKKVKNADTLAFAIPLYYYEMRGQIKTLLDRLNPLCSSVYKFRNVYILSVAAEDEEFVPKKAESGLQRWVDCFGKVEFFGSLFCGEIGDMGEALGKADELNAAYEFGKALK